MRPSVPPSGYPKVGFLQLSSTAATIMSFYLGKPRVIMALSWTHCNMLLSGDQTFLFLVKKTPICWVTICISCLIFVCVLVFLFVCCLFQRGQGIQREPRGRRDV